MGLNKELNKWFLGVVEEIREREWRENEIWNGGVLNMVFLRVLNKSF